jgi:hypothetical protein
MLEDAPLPRPSFKTTSVDPAQARSRQHRPRRPHLKLPLASARNRIHAQTQRIVMINYSLQRSEQMILPQTRRHLQQHRLVEPINRTATLQQPAHDRRRH